MINTQSPAPGVAAEVGEILPILEQLVVALASQDEEGLIEHAEPMIAARRLIGKLKEPAPAGRWIAFKDRMPPEDGALDNSDVKVVRRVLVTNNLSARDRMGRMSHIWLAMPLESSDGTIVAFTEADTKIHGLTHWLDPMPSLASRTALQASAAAVPVEYQTRMRPIWFDEGKGWQDWTKVSKETYEDALKLSGLPHYNEWQYEARALYTAPPHPAQVLSTKRWIVAQQHPELPDVSIFLTEKESVTREFKRLGWTVLSIDGAPYIDDAPGEPDASDTPALGMAVGAEQWLPMDSAPTDGTMVRLLVDYSGEDARHPLEDATPETPRQTIGANNDSNVGDDEAHGWLFAGWSWEQDCFTQGHGEPIGWLPFAAPHPSPAPQAAGADPVKEKFEKDVAFWMERGHTREQAETEVRYRASRAAVKAVFGAGRAGS